MSKEMSKKRPDVKEANGDGPQKSQKLARLTLPALSLNRHLEDAEFLGKLTASWGQTVIDEKGVKFEAAPFPHGEIQNVFEDSEFLNRLQKEKIEYEEKASDLFHFHQSCDLSLVPSGFPGWESIEALNEFFKTKLFKSLKTITGLPLSGKFDIFASEYVTTDRLLCHDDELDSRRIAFIIYMTEGWQQDFGGTLDLFDSTDGEDGPQPTKVKKRIVPEFNKLVFFEVSAASFHQVSEVMHKTACRRAISGWYYGEPLPRPALQLPEEPFKNVNYLERPQISLDNYLDKPYLKSDTLTSANDQLSENSEILLSSFFKPDVYNSIRQRLQGINSSKLQLMGPPNLRNYQCLSLPPPTSQSGVNNLDDASFPKELISFFGSQTFLEFLQELTEFPFASEPELRFNYSLKKFQSGSYTLVKGKDRTRGYKLNTSNAVNNNLSILNAGNQDEDDEELDSELIKPSQTNGDLSDEASNGEIEDESRVNDHKPGSKRGQLNGESSALRGRGKENGEVSPDQGKDQDEAEDLEEYLEEVVEEDEEDEDAGTSAMFLDTEGEETGEPNRVDVMYFVFPPSNAEEEAPDKKDASVHLKWEETWGGNRVYTDDLTGNQLINIIPEGNALAIVVRDASISSHYQYLNCLSKDYTFYVYDFEFDFPTGG